MQFKNFIEGFKHFINPAGPARALLEEIGSQRMRIKHLQEEYRKVADWNSQYTATLGSITGSMEALIWKKDENHKYILANINHCKLMFGIDATTDCLLYIKGKTDHQMVYETYDCLGLLNTFPDLCLVSDEYVAEKKEICHFIEVGIIDDQEMLFYVVKIPQFINGKYVGTVGIGWDFTSRADFFVNLLNRWIFDKKATIIFEKDKARCYSIIPSGNTCEIFKHLCPRPQNNKMSYCSDTDCDSCLGDVIIDSSNKTNNSTP